MEATDEEKKKGGKEIAPLLLVFVVKKGETDNRGVKSESFLG